MTAAACYREAYGVSDPKLRWVRVAAYDALRKPHIAAMVSRLKAEYDSVRPALTRAVKREILHEMTNNEALDAVDRQRAIDLDNKMQSEYSERMHLTQDIVISHFRGARDGTVIHWQLAENLPSQPDVNIDGSKESKTIDGCVTNVEQPSPDGGTGTLAIPDSSHSKPLSSSSDTKAIPEPQPVPETPLKRKGRALRKPLTKEQIAILGKTYANRRRKTKG